ncbi:MAG: SIMPL domain-containing protein [Leptolyngbya sp. SIO1E4]|nr:SIMPL domain-containing protein [Leptolyngbya sp. SIO1E4]
MDIRPQKIIGFSLCLGVCVSGSGLNIQPAIAQLLYPPVRDQQAVSVTGQGRASVPADQAQIDIWLTNRDPNAAAPFEFPPEPEAAAPVPEFPPLTFDSLRGVIDALVEAGVAESDIDVNLALIDASAYSYYSAENSITLNIQQPTQDRVNEIVQTVNEALETQSPQQIAFISRVFVQYAITSCATVEQSAYAAAMEDAKLRADAIANSMDVSLVEPPSVAELPFLGRFLSPCNEETDVIGALFWSAESSYYNPEAPAEVEVYREVLVTYPVE